jgi:hypothetical protein
MPIIGEIIAMDRRLTSTLPGRPDDPMWSGSALGELPAEFQTGAGSRI